MAWGSSGTSLGTDRSRGLFGANTACRRTDRPAQPRAVHHGEGTEAQTIGNAPRTMTPTPCAVKPRTPAGRSASRKARCPAGNVRTSAR